MAGAEESGSMHLSPILRARHLLRLASDLTAFAVVNRAWWVPPLTLLLALATLLVIIGQAAAPVTLYPLF
jgi:hypothetical protein